MKMHVNVGELNFRSRPDLASDAVVAKLRRGDSVRRLDAFPRNGFVRVAATIGGLTTEGYVWEAFLAASEGAFEPTSAPTESSVFVPPRVHLEARARRTHDYGHPYPLSEPPEPHRAEAGDPKRARSVLDVIRWLSVEKSNRYLPKPGTTYCNVYAYDFCYLTGAYLPRVWWTAGSLAKLRAGTQVRPDLLRGATVAELSANGLHQWLVEWGQAYAWKKLTTLDEIQELANRGGVAVICGRNDTGGSGHISIVAPESAAHEAVRNDGRVVLPMQSQAGGTNIEYGHSRAWWNAPEFAGAFGFWGID